MPYGSSLLNISTRVKHRTHHLRLAFHHHAPAYLDEDYPIDIEVTNTDIRDLQVSISLLLQPLEIEDVGMSVVYINEIFVTDGSCSELDCRGRRTIH